LQDFGPELAEIFALVDLFMCFACRFPIHGNIAQELFTYFRLALFAFIFLFLLFFLFFII